MNGHCNLCGETGFDLIKAGLRDDPERNVFRCRSCGHVQVLPRPTPEEDAVFYDRNAQDKNRGKDITYGALESNNAYDTLAHVELVRRLVEDRNASIVDVGSGYGFFLNGLAKAGYNNLLGFEVSSERREIALRNSGVRMIDHDVLRPDPAIGVFDVITVFHVLEHMADPVAFLGGLRRLMHERSILVCEVPNADELLLRESREYNDFYWIRAHLSYFYGQTLTECFRKAGFPGVELKFRQRYGLINLCSWLQTGKPQIERPVFEMPPAYRVVEAEYRKFTEGTGKSDAIIAIARGTA